MNIPCFVCEKHLESVCRTINDERNQPSGGTAFTSHGHYGSTVFDPMDRSFLELNICDECLKAKAHLVKHSLIIKRDEVVYVRDWIPFHP